MPYQRRILVKIDTPEQTVAEDWTDRPEETVPCVVRDELSKGFLPELGLQLGDTAFMYRIKEN